MPEASALLGFLQYGDPDVSMKLARQVVAGQLNLASGSDPWIQSTVDDSDTYLTAHPPGSNPKGAAKQEAEVLKDALDAYNNTPCE